MGVELGDIAHTAVHERKVGIVAVHTRALHRSAGAAARVLLDMTIDIQHIHF